MCIFPSGFKISVFFYHFLKLLYKHKCDMLVVPGHGRLVTNKIVMLCYIITNWEAFSELGLERQT